jgi:hypothetical protein
VHIFSIITKCVAAGVMLMATAGYQSVQADVLKDLLEDVAGADARRYGTVDTAGNTLASVSVLPVEGRPYKYLAMYHSAVNTGSGYRFSVHMGTSSDLLNWTHQGELLDNADMPHVRAITNTNDPSDTRYLLTHEQWLGGTSHSSGPSRLGFKLYDSIDDILAATPQASYVLPSGVQLSSWDLEGTPNIYGATFSDGPGGLTLNADIGFHYLAPTPDTRDEQGQGTLTLSNGNWNWTSAPATAYRDAFTAAGATGNIGDRDVIDFGGERYNFQEGNIQPAPGVPTDFSMWKPFLYRWEDSNTGSFPTGNGVITQLIPQTDGGSTAFGNPTVQVLPSPSGVGDVLFGSYFVFGEGAAPGEAAALMFYHELDSDPIPNRVQNGDFEIGNGQAMLFPSAWYRSGLGVGYVLDDDSDGLGTRSVSMLSDGVVKPDWRHPVITVDPGEEYDFSFDYKFESGTTGQVQAMMRYFSDENGFLFVGQEVVTLNAGDHGQWQNHASTYTIPNGVESVDLWFPTAYGPFSGEFRLDNVALRITPLEGDLDGDGFVGITDLNIVLGNWNQSVPPGDAAADPSGDGFVGIEDLNTVLGNWNAGTPPVVAIPEPATLGLCMLGVFALLGRQ